MMRSRKIRFLTMVMVIALLTAQLPIHSLAVELDNENETLADFEDTLNYTADVLSYREYITEYKDVVHPDEKYEITADSYTMCEGMSVHIENNYEGMSGVSVYTEERGMLQYNVEVEKEGLYRIALVYYPVEGKNASIQRSVFIDGKLPYQELSMVEFSRVWVNESEDWKVDNQGNELKANQVEAPEWIVGDCYDKEGYNAEPLSVYLTAGEHTITLVSLREPMLLNKILIYNEASVLTYEEVQEKNKTVGYVDADIEEPIVIQAERATKKSSQMLYPQQDQSSPSVSPYSTHKLLNNTIGGEGNWDSCGQWIEWEFEVEQSGYYFITLRAKQNFVKGTNVSRKITIDGEIPFEEMSAYAFSYDGGWVMDTLSNKEGEAYRFYLEEGKHTIRMDVVLGELGTIINDVEEIVFDLNAIYRKIIRITGVAPDDIRDYQIERNFPELESEFKDCSERLTNVITKLRKVAGKGSTKETSLVTMRDQLDELSKDVEDVGKYLSDFKSNIGATGTWITQAVLQPLRLDAIYISAPGIELPELKESFWDKAVHEVKKMFWSFIVDYNTIGNVAAEEETKSIVVWVGSGRDQANTIKQLIEEDFTPKTGISVNVMLVDMGSLLQATLSGQGPDVALQVSNDLPMNYGLRSAALNLAEVADEEEIAEVKSNFRESAFAALEYEDALYALPETETCLMMFYRKDILKELGVEIPKTWDDIKVIMSLLNNNQMALGMSPSEQVWASLLYQNGGEYYTEDATKSALDSTEAIDTFKKFTQFYTDFKLDRETSLTEGFRTGEMPIIIADSSTYNTLQVSAPEIKGLWGFTTIPGTTREDGGVDYTSASSGTACMIMNSTEEEEASWEFLKWWTSAEIQASYGIEMESLMGASARYMTANTEALAKLPWPVQDYEALAEQYAKVKGIRQVPGGYFTWRNVSNAFYRVVLSSGTEWMAPREALTEYINYINAEITYKRTEFGMKTAE